MPGNYVAWLRHDDGIAVLIKGDVSVALYHAGRDIYYERDCRIYSYVD